MEDGFQEFLEAHRIDWLAPIAISTFVQALETGIIIAQSVQFWSRAERETGVVKCIIGWVSLVAL